MREYLEGYLHTRLKTLMIGAIAAIEEEFGDELGLKVDPADRTPEQQKLFEQFQNIRSEILELGNQQIKKVGMELQLYRIKGPYYKYSVKYVRPEEKE